ncbi:MAG: hypothetical protein ACREQ4_04305 [Candidatus Binataceae bacterium]
MRRFDENFQILGPDQLRYCLRETNLDDVWPQNYSRSIASLQLLRLDDYLKGVQGRSPEPGLLTLSPPPRFDLLIVDEAHRLRNPETNSYELARFLSDVALPWLSERFYVGDWAAVAHVKPYAGPQPDRGRLEMFLFQSRRSRDCVVLKECFPRFVHLQEVNEQAGNIFEQLRRRLVRIAVVTNTPKKIAEHIVIASRLKPGLTSL